MGDSAVMDSQVDPEAETQAMETADTDSPVVREESPGDVSDVKCLDCGKIFKNKDSLSSHRRDKHSGVTKVHSCPECGKEFGRKHNLKVTNSRSRFLNIVASFILFEIGLTSLTESSVKSRSF